MTDVLVIGGGLAGWRAAQAACRAGRSVTLVANGVGNSPQIHALNCPVRPDDSVERFVEDTMRSGKDTNDRALVETLCRESVALKDEFAFDRDPDGAYHAIQPLGSTVPRCVSIDHAIGAIALRRIQDELKDKVEVVEGRVAALERIARCVGEGADATNGAGYVVHVVASAPPPTHFPGRSGYAFHFAQVQNGRYPHWTLNGVVYHICFRLADSVSQESQHAWMLIREHYKNLSIAEKRQLTDEERAILARAYSEKVEAFLDAGYGECQLRLPEVADIVCRVIDHDNGTKYQLHAVGVMPNHVHVIVSFCEGVDMAEVVQEWKSVSAHQINRLLRRKGELWQKDYYNHIIRDRVEYEKQLVYVGVKNAGVRGGVGCIGEGADATKGADATRSGAVRIVASAPPPTQSFSARAVVLATGGWCGKYDFSTNPAYLRGDGIALAQALGAAVRDMDVVQYEPTVRVTGPRRGVPVITTLLYKGATLRNERGEEFLGDLHLNKDEMSKAIFAEMARTDAQGVWYDLASVTESDLRDCKMDPTERRIFVAPAPHTSLGGVAIDAKCRVLGSDGRPIPGLFAAGEVTGGLHGLNRLGGNAGTETLVFGRIAGESAAECAKEDR